MSSSDMPSGRSSPRTAAPFARAVLGVGLALALGLAAGCTVRPLYGELAPTAPGAPSAQLASVDIPPVDTRVGQEVRNHLIFMFGGGQGRPASPAYRLVLETAVSRSVPATINTGRVSLEPTSGIVTVRAAYTLAEAGTGKPVASGTRSVQAPYDIPVQDFAAERAARDAENRAARELAELLRLVVGQELARR
jgi:LPS-assembly lipoprotein